MKSTVCFWLVFTFSYLLCDDAHSEDTTGFGIDGIHSKEFETCQINSKGTTVEDIQCLEQEFDRQDKQLNSAYRQLIARSSGLSKANLQKAERSWIKFRDAQCEFVYGRNGGDYVGHIAYSECRVVITNERLKALQGFLAREDERGL